MEVNSWYAYHLLGFLFHPAQWDSYYTLDSALKQEKSKSLSHIEVVVILFLPGMNFRMKPQSNSFN